jgi:DNA-binding IclR family transcriptional regulator
MTILRGLRSYTPHTVTAPDRFRRALAVVRLTRVAVTRFELEATTCGVAVPVFGTGGEVLAAIELTVPDLGRELQQVMAALSIAARSLSRELAGGCARISEGVAADTVGGVYATVSDVETRVAQHAG